MLYVNADDLGWTKEITDRILTCFHHGGIHTASAMTFMKDSERASDLSQQYGLPVGLHLNLTQDFMDETVSSTLRDHHWRVACYLHARKVNQILFNPFLRKSFEYVFKAQWEEFYRLYGKEPTRLDGHHHMHLSMNILTLIRFLSGLRIRRNFTFGADEKNLLNRFYRHLIDLCLISRFLCTDYFFSLKPIRMDKIMRIVELSKSANVELMVHPGVEEEYQFLLSHEWASLIFDLPVPIKKSSKK